MDDNEKLNEEEGFGNDLLTLVDEDGFEVETL